MDLLPEQGVTGAMKRKKVKGYTRDFHPLTDKGVGK